MKIRLLLALSIILFTFSFISATSDVQYWTGQYYTGTAYNQGTYTFNFTVWDSITTGTLCYSNITSLTTGYFGQWSTSQFNILNSCNNQSKNYFLNIRIDGVDQLPRKRLTLIGNWTTHELFIANNEAWLSTFNATYAANMGNVSWNQSYANILYLTGTFNSTYAGLINNESYLATFNSSYNSLVSDNSSWNESYANGKYLTGTYNATYDLWAYNQTTPATNYADTNFYNKSSNVDMLNRNITNTGYIKFTKITGPCDLTINGSICSNSTGTYIVG